MITTTEHIQAVETVLAHQGVLHQELQVVGQLHSREEIRIIARTAGRLKQMPITEGKRAHKGDLLVQIDAPELSARLQRIHSEHSKAQMDATYICRQADRDQELLTMGAVTAQKAEASRDACKAARFGVQSAAAFVKEQTILASKVVERAPFDGTVLR